jgi:hypothetical protein
VTDGIGYDPEQEAPGFHFNAYELTKWGITRIWSARVGSEAEREALRATWRADVGAYRRWNAQLWQAQRSNSTFDRKYPGGGSTTLRRVNKAAAFKANPDLKERYERGGATAIYQHAGCTPAECEVLAMVHEGKSLSEAAALRGVTKSTIQIRYREGSEKLYRLGHTEFP